MATISEIAGWSPEKSVEIAKFEAELSTRFQHKEIDLSQLMAEVRESKYTELDKQCMFFALGVFFGEVIRR